jgi:hypothetical protein
MPLEWPRIAPQNCIAQSGAVHEFGPLFQHRAKLGDVAVPSGLLEALDSDAVHESVQFRLTVEAVRTREDELRVMQRKRERVSVAVVCIDLRDGRQNLPP